MNVEDKDVIYIYTVLIFNSRRAKCHLGAFEFEQGRYQGVANRKDVGLSTAQIYHFLQEDS